MIGMQTDSFKPGSPNPAHRWLRARRVVLILFAAPAFAASVLGLVAIFAAILLSLPVFIASGFLAQRRFWRLARKMDRVADWASTRDRLRRGEGVLVLTLFDDLGIPREGYFLPAQPETLDPDRICLRLSDMEDESLEGFKRWFKKSDSSRREAWEREVILPRMHEAQFVRIPKGAMRAELDRSVRQERVMLLDRGPARMITRDKRCIRLLTAPGLRQDD